jgi:uroporphyrinogen decarboxylase
MGAYDQLDPAVRRNVDTLVAETHAANGLAPVDLEAFWRDNAKAQANPFGRDIPQCAFGANLTWECVYDELGIDEDYWRFHDDEPWALEVSKRYNDIAERIVGRRLLNEKPRDPSRAWPRVKELFDIFEARNVWEGGPKGSWWLHESAHSIEELRALLDRVEKRLENLREFLLPENWDAEKARLTALGGKVPLYRGQRGPCTFACSIFGVENMLTLHYDDPDLFRRFGDVLGRAILARARVLDEEAGFTAETAPKAWGWADDNCCLFTPEMFEVFAMPIHRAVFARYAPKPSDGRYQHSDSAMGHLLPLFAQLDMTGTNFGPTVTVAEIRRHCPHAVIDGQLAPFTYSRNEEANMVAEVLRDFAQVGDTRGLHFKTAGSINNGTRLTSMRLLMAAVQRYGRYDA